MQRGWLQSLCVRTHIHTYIHTYTDISAQGCREAALQANEEVARTKGETLTIKDLRITNCGTQPWTHVWSNKHPHTNWLTSNNHSCINWLTWVRIQQQSAVFARSFSSRSHVDQHSSNHRDESELLPELSSRQERPRERNTRESQSRESSAIPEFVKSDENNENRESSSSSWVPARITAPSRNSWIRAAVAR